MDRPRIHLESYLGAVSSSEEAVGSSPPAYVIRRLGVSRVWEGCTKDWKTLRVYNHNIK